MGRDHTPRELHKADARLGFSKQKISFDNPATGDEIIMFDPECDLARKYPNLHFLFHQDTIELAEKYGDDIFCVLSQIEKELSDIIDRDDKGLPPTNMMSTVYRWYIGRLDTFFYYNELNDELLSQHIIGLLT